MKKLLRNTLDSLSEIGVGVKVKIVFLCTGLLPPLATLLLLQQGDAKWLQSVLALYLAVCIALYYPFCRAMEELIVLRQARRINAYVDEVKAGRATPYFELPEEKGGEHDFLRLKRNIYWMVQGLRTREARLRDTLGRLKAAQRQVLESIEYASRIQRSFLPSENDLKAALGDYFLLWEPRDGVGGDAYWVRQTPGHTYLAVFDCTGHGVPGAFLTLIVNSLFEQSLDVHCRDNPARLLAKMNMGLKTALSQHGRETLSDDGLEGAVCCINHEHRTLHFAGARSFLLLVDDHGVRHVKGDRSGVGFVRVPMNQKFANKRVDLGGIRGVYLFTDGVTDQIGGAKKLPFGRSRLMSALEENSLSPMEDQRAALMKRFRDYKGDNAQRDDVTVLGFSVSEVKC